MIYTRRGKNKKETMEQTGSKFDVSTMPIPPRPTTISSGGPPGTMYMAPPLQSSSSAPPPSKPPITEVRRDKDEDDDDDNTTVHTVASDGGGGSTWNLLHDYGRHHLGQTAGMLVINGVGLAALGCGLYLWLSHDPRTAAAVGVVTSVAGTEARIRYVVNGTPFCARTAPDSRGVRGPGGTADRSVSIAPSGCPSPGSPSSSGTTPTTRPTHGPTPPAPPWGAG